VVEVDWERVALHVAVSTEDWGTVVMQEVTLHEEVA
jgi:hypothetical protein